MEASLLVAPKPSVPRAVSSIFSARRWRCLAVAAAATAHSKPDVDAHLGLRRRDDEVQAQVQRVVSRKSLRGLLAAAAAATSALLPLPCHASAAALQAEPSLQLYCAVAVLGDLDPATAKTVAGVAGPALSAFGFLFILRIVMSWYPRLPVTDFPYVLAYAPTEPFLAVTRKLIPPLGGVDVTPVVWFGLVSFLNEILVGPQGLLVLLSQQL